jgi:hypothetical protein
MTDPDRYRRQQRLIIASGALAIAAMLLVFFGALYEASQRDKNRREARIKNCRSIYESFNEVFDPFFPPPKERTRAQKRNLQKLADRVVELKTRCK